MRIVHISDVHFFQLSLSFKDLFSKKILGTLNQTLRRKLYNPQILDQFLTFLQKCHPSHIMISGDFTTLSSVQEFHKAAAFVQKLESFGYKVFSIPGNHDKYTRESEKKELFYRFISTPLSLRREGIAYEPLDDDWWYLGLDTSLATHWLSSQGLFSQELEGRLKQVLDNHPVGNPLIVVNHFPMLKGSCPKKHLIPSFFIPSQIQHSSNRCLVRIPHGCHVPKRLIISRAELVDEVSRFFISRCQIFNCNILKTCAIQRNVHL